MTFEQNMEDLKSDIEHLEDVLRNWNGQNGQNSCDACKQDHIRLLRWLTTLLRYYEDDFKNGRISSTASTEIAQTDATSVLSQTEAG